MPALLNARGNSPQRNSRRAQDQIDNLNSVPGFLPPGQPRNVAQPAEGALKSKVVVTGGQTIEFFQEQASSG